MNKEYILITGASSGIGYELAKIYAQQGQSLILVARNLDSLLPLQQKYQNIELISLDLSILDNAHKLYQMTQAKNYFINTLINNAGVGLLGDFYSTDLETEISMVNLNVQTLMILTKYYVQDMVKQNSGYILNVSSVAGEMPAGPMMSVYYATKAFVTSFSDGLRYELRKTNIKVSILAPGPTLTNFVKTATKENNANLFANLKFHRAETVAQYAVKNLGKPLIIPGLFNKLLVYSSYFMPKSIVLFIVNRIQSLK